MARKYSLAVPRRHVLQVIGAIAATLPLDGVGALSPSRSSTRAAETLHDNPRLVAERMGPGPVIYANMPGLEGELGTNIDGPAVIKVPPWIKNSLGRYYMYFAHHRGKYIRLAYADRPEGPWNIYEPGTLQLHDTTGIHHVASPDILIDDDHHIMVMYYHSPIEEPDLDYGGRPYAQRTFAAVSVDGINFRQISEAIAPPYMKTMRYKQYIYGLAMADKSSAYPEWLRSGQLLRSRDMVSFEAGPRIIDEMRHGAILSFRNMIHLFYTVVGDRPEQIYHATIDPRADWSEWTASAAEPLLKPSYDYEGSNIPLMASRGGMSSISENAVRDPAILEDEGRLFLFYTVAGERGIAVAQLKFR